MIIMDSYAHAEVQELENMIRQGLITIKGGEVILSKVVEEVKERINKVEEGLKKVNIQIEKMKEDYKFLSKEYDALSEEIYNLDAKATGEMLNNQKSAEKSTRDQAGYLREQRSKIEKKMDILRNHIENIERIKREYEYLYNDDKHLLDGLEGDKIIFKNHCEEILHQNGVMQKEVTLIRNK